LIATPLEGVAVIAARDDLLELANALRFSPAVSAGGVAQAELLLTDYDSPLNRRGGGDALRHAACAAIDALEADAVAAAGRGRHRRRRG
jgi:hypothetical protein